MLTPETLLRMDAEDAVYAMAQSMLDLHHPGVNARWYRAITPTVVEGTLTEVGFVIDKMKTPVDKWDVLPHFPLRYHRMNITDIVPLQTETVGITPTTTHYLLQEVLSRYSIPLSKSEVVCETHANIGEVPIGLNPEGYRWIGSTSVMYDIVKLDLAELILRKQVVTNFSDIYASANIRDDIVDHLNRHNAGRLPRLLNKGDLRLCMPLSIGIHSDAFNTKIKAVATGIDYVGSEYILYKRRSFQYTWRKPIPLTYNGWLTTTEMCEALSVALECVIVEADIDADVLSDPPPANVVVRFKPESLAYLGYVHVKLDQLPDVVPDADIRMSTDGTVRRSTDDVIRRSIELANTLPPPSLPIDDTPY